MVVQSTERQSSSLPVRSLGDLLNETFAIYVRHFRQFIGLTAVMQVPIAVIVQIMGRGIVAYGFALALGGVGSMFVYGAVAFAVGQQYVTGQIDIGACYSRVWWRVVSLTLLAVILLLSIAAGATLAILVIPAIAMLAYLVYWSVAIPAIVVETHKPVAALRRSFRLVRGSWWRIFGITIVVALVLIGLGLVLAVPFALAPRSIEVPVLGVVFELLGSIVVAVAVPPIAGIASTLIYYDLRVRKENYDLNTLSQEMGLAAV